MKKKEMISSIEYWIRNITADSKEKYDKDFILVLLHKWLGREYIKTFEGYMSTGRIVELFEAEYKVVHLNKMNRTLVVSDIYEGLANLTHLDIDTYMYHIPIFRLNVIELRHKTDELTDKCFDIVENILEIIAKRRKNDMLQKVEESISRLMKEINNSKKSE